MTKKILLTALIFTLTFSVNAQDWFGGSKRIKGNGNIVTVNRTTDNYRGIAAGGSFDVVLVKGKEGKITIEGEENIIPFIETEISGGILKIKYQKNTNIRTTKRVTVTVTFNKIESVALGGSGNISSEEVIKANDLNVSLGGSGNINLKIDTDTVSTKIGGSGNIELQGNTNELSCSIAGSGSIRAYNLNADEVNATIAGSGSVKTTVKNKIKAKLVGSGSIYYKGNPKHVDSKSVGSGSIIDRN
ncbi:head GIN domain-containing protein [Polaribacter sp. PL03]|uniref:head GIN domain-containing protein n=1 Tax=Polaribacter sp. PL03 TaxID=3088353 RepID=UPI0029CED8F3|nr:head GIN domain-containing protein [Polaribacter sp. PL03]MDX6746353.1 head GIN domain-containing protein [Polaribacter sp. PL03]